VNRRRGLPRVTHRVTHLVKRFWWAITARSPSANDRAWVESTLLRGELQLFDRMSRSDQEHHIRVARRFVSRLDDPRREWVAAALLHDSGKVVCGLGTFGRVFATVWPFGRVGDGRLARFHRHEAVGASLAHEAGSEDVTVALIGEWPDTPPVVADALYWADDL